VAGEEVAEFRFDGVEVVRARLRGPTTEGRVDDALDSNDQARGEVLLSPQRVERILRSVRVERKASVVGETSRCGREDRSGQRNRLATSRVQHDAGERFVIQ